jgi:hypothetical protein
MDFGGRVGGQPRAVPGGEEAVHLVRQEPKVVATDREQPSLDLPAVQPRQRWSCLAGDDGREGRGQPLEEVRDSGESPLVGERLQVVQDQQRLLGQSLLERLEELVDRIGPGAACRTRPASAWTSTMPWARARSASSCRCGRGTCGMKVRGARSRCGSRRT